MLKKLQTELRQTAKALLQMGETTTASALGHVAMALDKVSAVAGKATKETTKLATSTTNAAKHMTTVAKAAERQSGIYKQVAEGWKLNAVEAGQLNKAVGMLGKKYTYAANAQKEWVPTLKSALTEINKQKAALVASGKAITTHVSSQELFDRVNRKLSSGLHTISGKLTDYDSAMGKSLGRSSAFRKEVDKIAGAVGKQGESFKSQFAALTKSDDLWRKHVTTLHRSGEITTKVAKQMYAASEHLNMPLEKLRANIKATIPQVSLFSRAMSSLVAHLKSFAAYAAAASIITGIAGVLGLATRAIIKYDQALHDLQAITRATNDEVALMGERIREIGRTTKFSASEVAVAMRTLGQAGFTASEAVASIGAVADLATGTLTGMSTVVDLITTAIRAFDLRATETTRVADIFANAVNRSKLTIDKLRIAFNYIGPIAAKTGITLEETAATTMMLANAGIRASTIGTGLRRTFQQLIEPTEELRATIEAAGYTVEDFNPQMNDMRDIIRRLTEIVPDAEAAFRMFSLRSSAAVAALSSQGVASFDALHSAVLRSGAAAEMAETQIEGLGIIFKQAWDKAQDLALALGEAGVAGALKILGKSLQMTFDGIRFFIESGVVKAIVSVGALAVALYGLSKAWASIQMIQWVVTLKLFVSQLGWAAAATEGFGVALASLQRGVGPLLILMTALYVAYKLNASFMIKMSKVSEEYIDTLDKTHKKELERLEGIKRLVSITRDELAGNKERSNALIKLSELGVDLNLVIEKETGLVKNLTESILEHKGSLDEAAASFENYKEKARFEDLVAQAKLFEETGNAIAGVIPKVNYLKTQTEGLFGKMVGKIEDVIDKIPLIGASYESNAEKLDVYRKGIDALESQQGEAYEKMVGAVTSFGEITQEVWENYMLEAGASGEELADLFTDSTEKITRVHVEAYMRIQLARENMTEAEREELEKHLNLVGDLFDKVNNTTARRLEVGLKTIRKHYSEREKAITEFYDSDVLYLKEKLDFEAGTYEELLGLIRRQLATKLSLLDQSYEDEMALIRSYNLGMKEEQERLTELDKKRANRRLKIEQEAMAALSEIHGLQIESIKRQHETETAIAEKAFEKRKAAIEDYYGWRATKASQDIIVDKKAFGDRIAAEEKYYSQKEALANQEVADQKILQATLLDIEREKYLEILVVEEDYFKDQLAHEEEYVSNSRRLIEEKLASSAELYKDDAENRKKIEKELNDELLEIIRESRSKQEAIISKSYESRIDALSTWRNKLREAYSSAKDLAQSYADKVRDIEEKIADIRREGAEKIAAVVETTEERITRARRAGMSEALVLQDKIIEARRRTAEADRLAAEKTIESQKKAAKIYSEVQGIWASVAVAAQTAAKEGKSVGVSYKKSMEMVLSSGSKAEGAIRGYIALQEKQKRKDQEAARSARDYWGSVAKNLEGSLKNVAKAMSELDETLREVNGLAVRTREAIEGIGTAAEEVDLDFAMDVSGVEETVAVVENLGEAYKAIPPVLESTKFSMEEINASAASYQTTLDATADSIGTTVDAYAEYSVEIEEAKEKTEELSEAGEEEERVTQAQISAINLHVINLEKKTQQVRNNLKAEEKSLKTAEKKLKIDKQTLMSAKQILTQLLKSKTATEEEIIIARDRVAELERNIAVSERHVEAQKKIVGEAQKATSALEAEAAAARKLADSLGGVGISAVGMGKAVSSGTKSTVSVIYRAMVAFSELSEMSTKAADSVRHVFEGIRGFKMEAEKELDLTNLEALNEKLGYIVEQSEASRKKLSGVLWDVSGIHSNLARIMNTHFRALHDQEVAVLNVMREMIGEAIHIETLRQQLVNLAASASSAYEEAIETARTFVGETAKSASALIGLVSESERAIDSIQYLDDEQLEGLKSAIGSAQDQLIELTTQALKAKDALISIGEKLQDQLDRQLGNLTVIEERRYAAQIAEIERLYEAAGRTSEAHAAYMDALALAETYHRERLADLVEKQNARDLEAEKALHETKMRNLDEYLNKTQEGKKSASWYESIKSKVKGYAAGGLVFGSGIRDTIHAMLTPGEYVFKADTVRQLGVPFLNALNAFKYPVPAFAGGGLVEPTFEKPLPPIQPTVKQAGNIHLYVNITGAGEITEKQVRKWIIPAVNKIRRLER
jgi:TP901 family phage tail tape measure protein